MSGLEGHVRDLVAIFRIIRESGGISESRFRQHEGELVRIKSAIVKELVWTPGQLIHLVNPVDRKEAEDAIDALWNLLGGDEILGEMTSGGYDGLLVSVMGDYADRAVLIRPTFISIKPQTKNLNGFFEQSIRCWLFGLNAAAIVLCYSVLESLLKETLKTRNGYLRSLAPDAKRRGLIGESDVEFIDLLSKHRNGIVHELASPLSDIWTLKTITMTTEILERLLTNRD